MHTTWTDGQNSVQEMYEAAVAIGLKTILFSEHSRNTSGDWFGDFASEVRALPDKPCKSIVGTEVRIALPDGSLDLSLDVEKHCDIVMASVHRFPDINGQPISFEDADVEKAPQLEFELSMAALENPRTDILGHPFGMSLKRYNAKPPEHLWKSLMSKAAEQGVAIDLNGSYHSNLTWLLKICADCGAQIVFGSNAHRHEDVGLTSRLLTEQQKATP